MNPSQYTEDLAEEICRRLAEGEPLRAICRSDEKFPTPRTIANWRKAHPEFEEAFKAARELGADALAEQCLEIADDETHDWELSKKGPILNEVAIGRAKLRVWTRMQLLAKWFPQKYGDKLEHNHKGKIGLESLVAGSQEEPEQE